MGTSMAMVMDINMDMGMEDTGLMDMDIAMDSCMDYQEDMEEVMDTDTMEAFVIMARQSFASHYKFGTSAI